MTEAFVLKDEHLKLLAAMEWRWNDAMGIGAPEVDVKRPFGFSYGYEYAIAEILGVALAGEDEDGSPALTEEQEEELRDLYGETLRALLVVLSARSCRTGTYVRGEDGQWAYAPRQRRAAS